jgi:hypothetical protein
MPTGRRVGSPILIPAIKEATARPDCEMATAELAAVENGKAGLPARRGSRPYVLRIAPEGRQFVTVPLLYPTTPIHGNPVASAPVDPRRRERPT